MSPRHPEPSPPVEAYRWFVMYGTLWTEVVAATKDDAIAIIAGRLGQAVTRSITARRVRPDDDQRQASWKDSADLLGMRRWQR